MMRFIKKAIVAHLGGALALGIMVSCGEHTDEAQVADSRTLLGHHTSIGSGPVPLTSQKDRLLAAMDPICAHMCTVPYRADVTEGADTSHLKRDIDRYVHQIWLGDHPMPHAEKAASWQRYGEAFGYSYRLWTERDLATLRTLMPARNAALLDEFLAAKEYWGASDLIRLSLLETYGGIYADVDIGAPQQRGAPVNLAALIPMQNLVLATEFHARNTGNNVALFVGNGLMMACVGHPMVAHLVRTIADNVAALRGADGAMASACHMTGPFFVNRSLGGAFTVIPITQLDALGMLH